MKLLRKETYNGGFTWNSIQYEQRMVKYYLGCCAKKTRRVAPSKNFLMEIDFSN